MRVERVVTAGTFTLDGGSWDVENNVWLVGDDDEVLVVDAAHDAAPIEQAVGSRRVVAVVCTHAHDDHVSAARELAVVADAPVLLHPADEPLWRMTYPDWRWSRDLADGDVVSVTSKVVSKAEGRTRSGDRDGAIDDESVRLVARQFKGAQVVPGEDLGRGVVVVVGESYKALRKRDVESVVAVEASTFCSPPDSE